MLDKKSTLLYAATSANLFNFLGRDDFENHFDVYQSVVSNALRAHKDLNEFGAEGLKIIDPFRVMEFSQRANSIFITFHTGSFNMLISQLLIQGHQFSVLADTGSMGVQDYINATRHYQAHYNHKGSAEMLNVEEDGSIFRIVRKIREGQIVLAFIDGNRGIGGVMKDNENLQDIRFFNGVVRVRKGLPYVAYLINTPVVLALNYTLDDNDYLRLYKPITKEKGENKETFCERTLNQIFKWFEEHIEKYCDQWSMWPYVQHWADLSVFSATTQSRATSELNERTGQLSFDNKRFCPMKIEDGFFLFDRKRYTLTQVDEEDIVLFSSKTTKEERSILLNDLLRSQESKIQSLVSKGVFIEGKYG